MPVAVEAGRLSQTARDVPGILFLNNIKKKKNFTIKKLNLMPMVYCGMKKRKLCSKCIIRASLLIKNKHMELYNILV